MAAAVPKELKSNKVQGLEFFGEGSVTLEDHLELLQCPTRGDD
jgi:hypothetical protein